MADWTAITGITGIVVSGMVGPSVAAIWASRRQAAEAKAQIALTGRAAARALLDEVARRVREAIAAGAGVYTTAMTWGSALGRQGGKDEWEAFRLAAREVDMLGSRVKIMFGPKSDVTKAFDACFDQLRRITRGAYGMARMDQVQDADEALEPFHDIDQGMEEVQVAYERLLEAAHAAIGVD